MEDAAFTRDRLHEAGAKLAEWVEALKALEADRRSWAEHERVLDERDRLAEEMGAWPTRLRRSLIRSGGSIFVIARLGGSTRHEAKFGYIRSVLSGAAPAITALFQDALVWDTFMAVAGLQSAPVVSCGAGANDKPRVRRSASSPAAV